MHSKMKMLGKILFAIGIGGLSTFWALQLIKINLLPFAAKLNDFIVGGHALQLNIGVFEIFLIVSSVLAILSAPLLIYQDKRAGAKILGLLLVAFVNAVGIFTVMARGEIYAFYVALLWFSLIYLAWFCLEILKAIILWVKA